MRPLLLCVLALLVLSLTGEAHGQGFRPEVSVSVGVIDGLEPFEPAYAVYPRVHISTPLFGLGNTPNPAIERGLQVEAYAGGWTDGIDRENMPDCADCIIYSYSSAVVGARLRAEHRHVVSLALSVGISRHFVWAEHVDGVSWGVTGRDHREDYTAAEVGAEIGVPLWGPLEAVAGAQGYASLEETSTTGYGDLRPAYSFGLSYAL